MAKALTPEKSALIQARDAKELKKWETVSQKPVSKYYFIILMVILVLIYCIDEITSRSNNIMQYDIFLDFFNATSSNDQSYIDGNDRFKTLQIIAGQVMIAAPFYKALADKLGRRIFLALNTVIFGIALLITAISDGLMTYVIGLMLVSLVSSNDVQVMYIMEVAPEKHRAKICSIVKALAVASTCLLGLLRSAFYDAANPSWWRPIFIIPAIFAVVIGTIAFFFSHETPVFIEDRMEYLKKTPEQREKEKAEKKAQKKAAGGGIINAIKYIFTHKQTLMIAIVTILVSLGITSTNYGNYILDDSEKWTIVVSIYPLFGAAFTFISGFVSDKMGRKIGAVIFSLACALSLGLFVIGASNGWNTVLIACFYGLFHGSIYCLVDVCCVLLPGESVQTNMRASVMAVLSLILFAGEYAGGFVIGKIAKAVCGVATKDAISANVWGNVVLWWAVPILIAASILIFIFVKETKGTDLRKVGKEE